MEHYIDYKTVSKGLGLSEEDTRSFLQDGRIMGRLGEFIVANKVDGNRADSENAPFDVISDIGKKIEVRSVTTNVNFASSKEIGSGREVTEEGFKEKLNSVDYYIVVNYQFDNLKFYDVFKQDIKYMDRRKMLSKNKSVNRDRFLNYMTSKDRKGAPAKFFDVTDEDVEILGEFFE